jgi:nitrite reductase (NADH) small subunit
MNAMSSTWITVCSESDLVCGSGVCALVETGSKSQQVALFRETPDGPVYAISNYDPIGDANVLSRGIIGSLGDKIVVASPLYKQHFNLETGECVEDASVKVPSWRTRIEQGAVQILVP